MVQFNLSNSGHRSEVGFVDERIERLEKEIKSLNQFVNTTKAAISIVFKRSKRGFILTRSNKDILYFVFMIPVALGIIINYIVQIVRKIPEIYGGSAIEVAVGQAQHEFTPFSIYDLMFSSYLPAFNEEFLYKYFFLMIILMACLGLIYTHKKISCAVPEGTYSKIAVWIR